jgi:hypothetical protein
VRIEFTLNGRQFLKHEEALRYVYEHLPRSVDENTQLHLDAEVNLESLHTLLGILNELAESKETIRVDNRQTLILMADVMQETADGLRKLSQSEYVQGSDIRVRRKTDVETKAVTSE